MVDAVAAQVAPAGGAVVTALGVENVTSDDVSGVPAAAALAATADAVVLVLGSDLTTAREGSDATSIAFSDGQLALADAVAAAVAAAGRGAPVVVVTLTATPLDLSPLLADARVGALLHVGQPSVQTLGIGDVLFGAISPAGRAVQARARCQSSALAPSLSLSLSRSTRPPS